MKKDFVLTKKDLPQGWSIDSADFINKLLKKQPNLRLGSRGIDEIKSHSWLKYFNWKDLYLHKMTPPFVPSEYLENNYNVKYCNMVEKIGVNTQERYKKIKAMESYPQIFAQFTNFNRYAEEMKKNQKEPMINPHSLYSLLEEKEQMAF